MIAGEPELDDDDNTMLCAIIIAKISPLTHSNVVNTTNEVNAQLLWKAILKRFISIKLEYTTPLLTSHSVLAT
jgi:hypothetical protein